MMFVNMLDPPEADRQKVFTNGQIKKKKEGEMRYLKVSGFAVAVLFLCGAEGGGCAPSLPPAAPDDPAEDELAKGRNFDIQRTRGLVTSLGVRYFVGDQKHTAEQKGQAYYFVQVQVDETVPQTPQPGLVVMPQPMLFVGIPKEVYDALELNMRLPAYPLLVQERLPFFRGRVVDKVAYPRENEFFVVVDDGKTVRTYRLTAETYYRDVMIGMELPPSAQSFPVESGEAVRSR